MKKILSSFKKQDILLMIFVIALIVAQVWLDLTMPDFTANLTKSVTSNNLSMKDIWYNGGMMLLCALGSLACAVICGFLVSRIAGSFSKNIREKLFNKITSFSSSEMNKFSTASLITRSTLDVDQLHRFIAMGLQMLIKAPILAIWAICKISLSSFEWTLATAIVVLIIITFVSIAVSLSIPKFKRVQKLTDELNNATRENLSGVRVVRAFNAESFQEEKFENVNTKLTKNHLFTSRVMGLMSPVLTICMNGLTLAIYFIGAMLINKAPVIERATVIGNMTAFTQYALQVVMAFMMLVMMFVILPRVIVSSKRISEVLNTTPSIESGNNRVENSEKGEIEFKNVCFKFPDGANNALEDINFKISSGETVAFIGATGSGKSTLIDLLTRVYDVTSGSIEVDGEDIKTYSLEDLQNKISVANQKAIMFKGTIKHNIAYGSVLDENKVCDALKIAEANFVFDLENGIDSLVSQGGTNFSGGQKQRLSIARTVYKNSEILVFDDSFSALDYKTDALVRQNLKEHLKNKTIIIVAQRIGTIMNADKIVVLDGGRIVGIGKHKELMNSCNEYKEIALSQLSKEEL